MNINFLIVQVIGFVAWILLMISYYQEDTNRILFFQQSNFSAAFLFVLDLTDMLHCSMINHTYYTGYTLWEVKI